MSSNIGVPQSDHFTAAPLREDDDGCRKNQTPVATVSEDWTREAMDYCGQHGMQTLVANAIRLAKKHFKPTSLSVYLSGDPDSDEEWLVLCSDVSGSVATTLEGYWNLKTEWLASVSNDQASLVRFLYNIL